MDAAQTVAEVDGARSGERRRFALLAIEPRNVPGITLT